MCAHLDVTCPTIQIQMQVLDLSKVRKLVVDILLACLLVYICGDDDPAFDGADGGRVGVVVIEAFVGPCFWVSSVERGGSMSISVSAMLMVLMRR